MKLVNKQVLLKISWCPNIVRLGPSPKLKLKPKGLDQSITLNSHITTHPPPPPTTNKLFYQFQYTNPSENQYISTSAKNSIAMKKSPNPSPHTLKHHILGFKVKVLKTKLKPNSKGSRLVFKCNGL
jgi:hypothetical protein